MYRAWEALPPAEQHGQFARIFVLDIGRRWGKTSLRFVIRVEDCIRNPGHVYRYVTAYQKDVEEIVDDVSRVLLDSCPEELRPEYRGSFGAQSAGFYFPNGSVLKLAGLDKNPNALRGRASDGDDISEAVFLRNLVSNVKNVLYAQYQGKPHARMCLESSGPEEPDSDYDRIFVADAKARGAYYYATIDDNTSLSDAEREEFIRAAGGREHPDCQREYFNIRVRDPERVLIPEFDQQKHVRHVERPEHFCSYVGADPGIQDMLALVFGYWHHELDVFVVEDSWCEYNAGTHDVAAIVREYERRLWGDTKWWSGKRFEPNPFLRVSDTDLRFVHDMATEHEVHFQLAAKTDVQIDGRNQSTLQHLRTWFKDDRIVLLPTAGPVIDHLVHGKWNERRTDWERSEAYGHFDCCVRGTLVRLERGNVPIESVRVGDRAWTRQGLRRVSAAWLVGDRRVWRLCTTAGTIEATANHRVWTENRGWVMLAELQRSDILCAWANTVSGSRFGSTAGHTGAIRTPRAAATACISLLARAATCIATCGLSITERFQAACMSTMPTATLSTTTSATWSFLPPQSTRRSTLPSRSDSQHFARASSTRTHGQGPQKAGRGTPAPTASASTLRKPSVCADERSRGSTSAPVSCVGSASSPLRRARSFVEATAAHAIVLLAESISSRLRARNADASSSGVSTPSPRFVRARVTSCRATEKTEPVYDLTVDDEHEFFANDVLVHNCIAALKYLPRHIECNKNPSPPLWVTQPDAQRGIADMVSKPSGVAQLPDATMRTMRKAFGQAPKWKANSR
jgi:hypothetical protein